MVSTDTGSAAAGPRAGCDDRLLAPTRWLAALIIPFLVVAFVILYFWPQDAGRLFAWPIAPSMTAMMLASAYLGGIWYFAGVWRARRWHHVHLGMLPVTAFSAMLGVATVLHWDRFTPGHISFITWTALYGIAPFLVMGAWLANRIARMSCLEARSERCMSFVGQAMSIWPAVVRRWNSRRPQAGAPTGQPTGVKTCHTSMVS